LVAVVLEMGRASRVGSCEGRKGGVGLPWFPRAAMVGELLTSYRQKVKNKEIRGSPLERRVRFEAQVIFREVYAY
jgi:hypothetical protein